MAKPFLGVGLGFPIALGSEGSADLGHAAYEESIRQSIWLILGTARGERVMRPDFGCGIHDLVFRSFSAALVGQTSQLVREALIRFEPRVEVLEVRVQPEHGGQLITISIEYRVRATNSVFNLVYPFYLEMSGTHG